MKTLSKRINLKFGEIENAYIIKNAHIMRFNAFYMLSLICADLNINLDNISDSDFKSASIILEHFCKGTNNYTGFTVSIWFDEE